MAVISGFMCHVTNMFLNLFMITYLVANPSSDSWYCCSCIYLTGDHSSLKQSSSCVCLNARSIFPKRFTLLAFLSAIDYDVVAVTETF